MDEIYKTIGKNILNRDIEDGLDMDKIIDRIHKAIDEELEITRELNPQMAMGMLQVKKLINEEFGYI